MAKKIAKVVKMELPGGEAKPGPKLASAGIVMPKFCTDFNAKTADRRGEIVPVIITAYEDKSFDYVIKTAPVAGLLLKAAGIKKGAANPKTTVMIGDAPMDYISAKNAGIENTILVSTGQVTLQELNKTTPYCIDSLDDVIIE